MNVEKEGQEELKSNEALQSVKPGFNKIKSATTYKKPKNLSTVRPISYTNISNIKSVMNEVEIDGESFDD